MGIFLVVDDEEDLRELIALELAHHGHQAHEASSVEAALELLRQQTFDVIITDLRMPKQSGLELLDHILTFKEKPRVILMSGLSDITLQDVHDKGAVALLAKPFRLDELVDIATRALDTSPHA